MLEKKSYHHGNLKEALIDAARALLDEVGVEGLSLRKVAQQAGVSPTALYSHFADKRELLAHLAARGYEQFSKSMRSELPKDKKSGKSYLMGLARGYVYFATSEPQLFQLMFSRELGDLNKTPELEQASTKAYELMAKAVKKQVKQDGSKVEVEFAIAAAWSLAHGLASLLNEDRLNVKPKNAKSLKKLVNKVSLMLNFAATEL